MKRMAITREGRRLAIMWVIGFILVFTIIISLNHPFDIPPILGLTVAGSWIVLTTVGGKE